MKNVVIAILAASCLSCTSVLNSLTPSSRQTIVDPLPVKAAIKESSIFVAVPVAVQKKITVGYRSLVEIQFEFKITKRAKTDAGPDSVTGIVVGPKIRF
jgi:hypothetical protein